MSIVGTQSVSMSDLMKLGPQALGAMAQGQTQSIAPSYMVLAALKALTDTQKGMQTQVPGQTIKDQVVAQSVPPQQAGIGAMAPQPPVQKFSGGGSPKSFAQDIGDWFSQFTNDVGQDITDIGRGKFRRRTEEETNYGHEGNNYVTQATTPTVEGRARLAEAPNIPEQTKDLQPGNRASISASSATSRGGIGGGKNLLEKYQKTIGKTPGAEEFPLDIPVNKQLEEAVKKYSTPDEKRMKELRDAEARTGILQFGAEMLEGGNFGSTFAKAVNKGNAAQQAEAEKRRAYEDKREAVATELGIKQGESARADFLAKTEYGDKKAQAAVDAEYKKADLNNQATRFGNQDILEQQKLGMMAEANRIAAEIRRDGLKERNIAAIQGLYTKAQELAVSEAEREFGKTDFDPMLAMSPQIKADLINRQDQKRKRTEQLMMKYVGELESRIGPLVNGTHTMTSTQGGPSKIAKDYTK